VGTLSLLTVLSAAAVNRQLRGGPPVRSSLFEDFVKPPGRLEFVVGDRAVPADDWAGGLRGREAIRARLTDGAALGSPEERPVVGGREVHPRMLAGFAGPSALLLAIDLPGTVEVYQPAVGFSRRTLLGIADVLRFVESFPRSEELKEALLWEAEHNLGFAEGTTWEAFTDALGPADAERLVDTVSRRFSNVKFEKEAASWGEVVRKARNPDFGPIFRYSVRGSVDRLPPSPRLDAQAERLAAALADIHRFASAQGIEPWAGYFEQVRGLLGTAPLEADPAARALLACALPEKRVRLAAAALHADVFGGMGSWNDLGFPDNTEYDAVSERLYKELNPSLQAAVNDDAG